MTELRQHRGAGHGKRLRRAFDRGAARYDTMVAINPGYHRHLRSAAEELLRRIGRSGRAPDLLDLACGSGASTRALLTAVPDAGRVLGVDMSPGMLDQARKRRWPAAVSFVEAEVGDLDVTGLGAGRWHGALAAYLFRNVPEETRDTAASEVFELLEPGGWLVAQEYSVAASRWARVVWDLVSWSVIIPLGILLDRNPRLYLYLWRSVHAFDSPARFTARLTAAGFTDVTAHTATGWQRGILHTFVARKPVPDEHS